MGRVWPRHGHRGRPLNSAVSCHSMNSGPKGNLLYVIVVGGALALIAYFGADYAPGGVNLSSESVVPSATVEGEVLSIAAASRGSPGAKEAVVKLTSGETVRAYVPPACVVFPGQIAKLARFGEAGTQNAYVLKEGRERNDS